MAKEQRLRRVSTGITGYDEILVGDLSRIGRISSGGTGGRQNDPGAAFSCGRRRGRREVPLYQPG